MSASSGDTSLSVHGGGAGLGIAIGGAVARNLIIYGTLVDSVASSPTFTQTFAGQTSSSTANNASAGVVGIGAGLAYYLDSNVFFAGSLLASRLVINDSNNNPIARTDLGFTFEGLVGKEWWVSDNWGLGVSAQVMAGVMKDQPQTLTTQAPPTWSVLAFNLLFSATYN
jgi:hypothetical protein